METSESGVAERRQGGGRHVLLVEDDELVAMSTGFELERLGWKVIGPVTSLDEALAVVQGEARIDGAIIDVNLQGRWSHALAEELGRRQIPFVVCTGYEMVDPDGRFAGAPLIAKPFAPERVGSALDALVGPVPTPEPGPDR